MGHGQLELALLGPIEARRDGAPLRLRTKKSLALLAYLATEGRPHRRAELAALLWPTSEEPKARTTLRSVIADLRSALGPGDGPDGPYLLGERDSLRLGADLGVNVDLTVLQTAYERARSSARGLRLDSEEGRELRERLRAGVTAYRGDFLQDFHLDDAPGFDYWASLERERWRARLTVVLDRLSGLLLDSGETQEAVPVAERWTAEDPSSTAASERLMRAAYAVGDRAGALRVYQRYRVRADRSGRTLAPELRALAARVAAETTPAEASGRESRETPGTPLVGRARQFDALVADYYATLTDGPRVVAIRGEAGIGKTRLVQEFLRWAVAQGADVLRAPAFEATEGLPYGPVVVALRTRMDRERAPDDLLDDIWLAELTRLLPELTERYPDLPPPSSDESSSKARLFEAVATFVANLAARRPVVLFFDDNHWTDAASLDLLHYATRTWVAKGVPVLLVVAARVDTPEVRARLVTRRASFARHLPVRRELLLPLTRRDTIRLVRERVAPGGEKDSEQAVRLDRFAQWLHDETGGQPFFLTETLADLIERGVVVPGGPSGGGWLVRPEVTSAGTTPPGVREAILARLERLSPDASKLLAAAAVVGRHCTFEVLRRVAGVDEDPGLAALDEALASDLLSEAAADAYACAHDKVRDVVYTEAGGARRRIYHRRALETLAEGPTPAAELARHALAASVTAAAFHHSVAAAEQALAVFAVEDARAHFGRARTLLEDEASTDEPGRLGAVQERLRLYRGLGSIHEVSREWADAQHAYEQMLTEARRAGDPEAEWSTLHRLAALGIDEGDVRHAERGGELHRKVRTRRSASPEGDDRTEGFRWSLSTARARETAALGLAREMRRPDLTAQSLTALGVLEALSGRWDPALAAAEEGIAICTRTGDQEREAELLNLAARCLTMTGAPRAAVARMRNHPGLTGALGDREVHRADVFSMALALTDTGRYDEALAVARAGLAAARSLDYAPRLWLNLLALGDTLQTLFRLEEAGDVYREMADVVFPPEYRSLVHAKLSAVAALAGHWDEAYAEALRAAAWREEAPVQSTEALHRHLEVEALLRGGDRLVVREQLGRFGEAVGDNRRLRLAYGRSSAVLRRFDGDGAAARHELHEARELAEELDLPAERWQLDASLAETAAEQGADTEAHRFLIRAADGVRGLAAGIRNVALRQGFLAAAPVRRVLTD